MKLVRTMSFILAWLLGVCAAEAVVYSTGSLNQDWLNASNWGGTDPAAQPSETFIIQSGHILGPVDGSSSATLWPSAGLRVESGGILSLDKGDADFSQARDGLELNGGQIQLTDSAVNQEAELVGDLAVLTGSSLSVDADMLILSGGKISGTGALSLTRSINSPETGDGFPALVFRSKMFDFSGNIDTSSWSGWGRFLVQNGNWGTGDFTLNPTGGGVLRAGMSFNAHGRLLIPNSSAKLDLRERTNIILPGSVLGSSTLDSTGFWVNDNTLQFTDVPTSSGSANISAFLINSEHSAISISNPWTSEEIDVNNLFDLDEPISMKNLATLVDQAADVDDYRSTLGDPNAMPYALDDWRWGVPYYDIFRIDAVYQMTRAPSLLEASTAIADNIKDYLDQNPSEAPITQDVLEVMKFIAPAVSARVILEHALLYPDEVSAEHLTKALEYLEWSTDLFNRFAVTDGDRPAVKDTRNGLYPEGNRSLMQPWNRQLWMTVPCAIAREAMEAYAKLYPGDTRFQDDAKNYQRLVMATAEKFKWNAALASFNDRDYAFWGYGTERHWDVYKTTDPAWVDDLNEGRIHLHQHEDSSHVPPDIFAFSYFAGLAEKHPEYAVFREITERTINAAVDYCYKFANSPSASSDPRKGPVYVIAAPWAGKGRYDGRSQAPSNMIQPTAHYRPEAYVMANARKGIPTHGLFNIIQGKMRYLAASEGTPAAPENVTVESSGGFLINWPRSPEPDVTGYHVYRASAPGGPTTRIATDVIRTEFLDSSGSGVYVVTAVDSSGNESPASAEAVSISLPSAPANLVAQTGSDGVKITWDAVSGSDVIGYNVYRSHGGSTAFYPIRQGVSGTEWVDTLTYNDTPTNPAHYKVTALNSKYEESDFSNEIILSRQNFVVFDDLLVVEASAGTASMDVTANDVVVEWDSPEEINTVGDSIVSTLGSLVFAHNLGGSATTVNGVTFEPKAFETWHFSNLITSGSNVNVYTAGSVGSTFETLLDSFCGIDRRVGYNYLVGLEPGKSYELQLFVSDDQGGRGNAERQFSLCGVQSPAHTQDPGYSQTCRFTANCWAPEMQLSNKGDDVYISLNGYQVREIPSIQKVSLQSVSQPAHGSVTVNGNDVTYQANPGYAGEDRFTYQAVELNSGQVGTGTVNVVVNADPMAMLGNLPPKPIIQSTARLGAAPLTVEFDASLSSDDGAIVSYEWDFDDDGQIDSIGATASHLYADEGSYRAVLRVTDDQGEEVVTTVDVLVGNPLAPRVWYKFNETSGLVAHDSSGRGFDGAITRSSSGWIPAGAEGGALDFDGQTRISIPDGVFSTLDQELTMSFWIHDQGRTFTDNRFLQASCPQGSWRSNLPWGIGSDYEVKFEFAGEYVYYKTSDFNDIGNGWTHWVVIKNVSAGGNVQIYRNGVLETDWGGRYGTLENTTDFTLGAYDSAYFDGAVDDFRIYDRALGLAEVTELYNGAGAVVGYNLWKKVYELVPPQDLAEEDPDGDGLENMAEYALNLDPTIQDASLANPMHDLASDNSYVDVTYREATLANSIGDVSVALVGTDDLLSPWQTILTSPLSTAWIESGTTRLITQRISLTGTTSYFLGLQVTAP